MSEHTTLIILAGGESKRMGRPKHLLPTPQGTMLDHLLTKLSPYFTETLVVGRNLSLAKCGIRVVEDIHPTRSPLVGIYSGLVMAKTDLCFVLACDMPLVRPRLVAYILSRSCRADACVPVVNGYYEPLCAAYRQTAIPVIAKAIDHGDLKVTNAYHDLKLCTIPEEEVRLFDPQLASFTNLNVPHQLKLLTQL